MQTNLTGFAPASLPCQNQQSQGYSSTAAITVPEYVHKQKNARALQYLMTASDKG